MTFDWTISFGSILTLVTFVATVVAAYYRLLAQVDSRLTEFSKGVEKQFSTVSVQLTTILEGDVRELRARVVLLESGQSEWVKTVRDRTHQLADHYQSMLLRIDRLERSGAKDGSHD